MRDVAYVALGSNVGDRAAHLATARAELGRIPGARIVAASAVEETAPIGPVVQGPYFNQMLAIETDLTPRDLLDCLHVIEHNAGRVRGERWGPRTLDLDIVLMEHQRSADPQCRVPHPELSRRDFWLRELAELRAACAR